MYATDAIVWLQQFDGHSSLERLGRLDVAPALAPGSEFLLGTKEYSLSAFGFGADGAMVNGTYVFALVAIVLFAVVQETKVPDMLVKFLQDIPVQQTKADSSTSRMVESMVISNMQSTVNRSFDDPLLLGAELARHAPSTATGVNSGASAIRNVVRLYKARTSLTPQLRMHKNTEEATVRIMDRTKFAEGSIAILSRIVCKTGWKVGPLSIDTVLAPALVIGAHLVESSNNIWCEFAVQTAAGQTIALTLLEAQSDREQASGCAITRHSKDVINKFAIAAGLWQQIITHLLPSSLLPREAVNALDEKFRQGVMLKGSLFEEVWQLAQCEVDDGISDVPALLPFVQKHLSELRHEQAAHRKDLRQAEAQHPTNLMTQQEMTQLTNDLYMGKLSLDANSYRTASQKLMQHLASEKDSLAAAALCHVKSVQSAQNHMQMSDVVFASPATGGLTVPDKIHWLTAAVEEAKRNCNRVSVMAHKTEVAVINIIAMPTHGMISPKLLQQMRSSVLMQSDMCGPILFIYPLVPRSVYKRKQTFTSSAATGASSTTVAGASAEGESDTDSNENDIFGEDGQLPDVLTKASTTQSKWERDTALARDRFQIDSMLGQHDLSQVCPKPITLSYKQDSALGRSSDKGLLLIPSPAPSGIVLASGGKSISDAFDKSALFRDGLLVDLEPPREFFNVSKNQHGLSSVTGRWLENRRAQKSEPHSSEFEDGSRTDRMADLRGLAHGSGQTLQHPESCGERFHGRSGRSRGRSCAGEGVRSCEAVRSARVLLGL